MADEPSPSMVCSLLWLTTSLMQLNLSTTAYPPNYDLAFVCCAVDVLVLYLHDLDTCVNVVLPPVNGHGEGRWRRMPAMNSWKYECNIGVLLRGAGPPRVNSNNRQKCHPPKPIFNVPQPLGIQSPASFIQCCPVFASSLDALHHLTLPYLRREYAKRRRKQN